MNSGQTVFSQLIDFLPRHEFSKCVQRYNGNHRTRTFSCMDQFLCMVFAQLTFRESLRDIEACLRTVESKLYHMGIRGRVSRSTLAEANENRDWRIYADFSQTLIPIARKLYAHEELSVDLDQAVYALDSTTISLCLSLFPWARFRRTKSAVKLHTLLNLRGSIPEFIHVSDGKLHDANVLDMLIPEPGSFYVMDRAYLDFARLHDIHEAKAFFITRAKRGFQFQRRYSHTVDKSNGVLCDQTISLKGFETKLRYPDALRRIRYTDLDTLKRFTFLTNNFALPSFDITQLYKLRWRVELFFKWIKQHLRIKAFYGTSENAVKTQIWIAVATYLLVAILKKRLRLEQSLYTILQILSVSVFVKTPVPQLFTNVSYRDAQDDLHNQLSLFDF